MEPTSRPWLAALWMSGAMLMFSLMAIAGRELSGALDTFEIMMYRSLIGIVIVVVVGYALGGLGSITTQQMGLHTLRNIGHFTGQNLWFFAVASIPLAQLFAFEFTTPIWVALLAPLFLGERMTATRVGVAILGFSGILIVARPGEMEITPGVIAAACCAIGFAASVITTKLLSRHQSVICILFWMVVMQFAFGLILAAYDGDVAFPHGGQLVWVTIISCCGLGAHFCVTTALSLAPASVVSPLEFFRLPLIAAVGLVLYQEPLLPSVFVGAAIVFTANLINLRAEQRRRVAPA